MKFKTAIKETLQEVKNKTRNIKKYTLVGIAIIATILFSFIPTITTGVIINGVTVNLYEALTITVVWLITQISWWWFWYTVIQKMQQMEASNEENE